MDKRVLLLLFAAGNAGSALGHHGTADFDHTKQVELVGTIKELAFVNPHSYVYFDVRDESGTATWRCEMRAATVLRRSGWTPEMFAAGRSIRIVGSPSRSQPHTCYVNTIEFADGSSADRYEQFSSTTSSQQTDRAPRLADGRPNLGGDWAAEQRVMTDPRGRTGRLVPLSQAESATTAPAGRPRPPGPPLNVQPTAAGAQAAAGYDARRDNPRFSCQPTNIFVDWTFDQHVNRIIQDQDTITMLYGFMDLKRTIRMDVSEHASDLTPSLAGDSIGRWDGDVLVVDTIGFSPGYLDTRRGIMYSDQMHVVERFTYDHDGRRLTRSWVAEDPLYFEGQYTGEDTVSIADIPYEPYNCDDRSWQDEGFAEEAPQ